MSILIKDTTREEREKIVAESIGNIDGSCDGCAAGLDGIQGAIRIGRRCTAQVFLRIHELNQILISKNL